MQQLVTQHLFWLTWNGASCRPFVLDQAKLYMRGQTPLAFVSRARLSPAAVTRYRQPPYHLAPSDWRSGDRVWIIDLVAPFGNAQEILKDIRENLFPEEKIYTTGAGAGR